MINDFHFVPPHLCNNDTVLIPCGAFPYPVYKCSSLNYLCQCFFSLQIHVRVLFSQFKPMISLDLLWLEKELYIEKCGVYMFQMVASGST